MAATVVTFKTLLTDTVNGTLGGLITPLEAQDVELEWKRDTDAWTFSFSIRPKQVE